MPSPSPEAPDPKPYGASSALEALFENCAEVLDAEEVADLLRISRHNTYVWLRTGVIPGYKVGSSWRVIRDELKDAVAQGTNRPSLPQPGTSPRESS